MVVSSLVSSLSAPNFLQQLGACRETLNTLCGERGRVLDLVPQPLRMILLGAGRDSWLGLDRPSSPWVERNETPIPNPVGAFTPGNYYNFFLVCVCVYRNKFLREFRAAT